MRQEEQVEGEHHEDGHLVKPVEVARWHWGARSDETFQLLPRHRYHLQLRPFLPVQVSYLETLCFLTTRGGERGGGGVAEEGGGGGGEGEIGGRGGRKKEKEVQYR